MNVVVEADVFRWFPDGGVARTYREILPRMCDASSDLTIEILAQDPVGGPLPYHSSIRRISPVPVDSWLRPHRLWPRLSHQARRASFTAAVRGDRRRLWHSTFYTLPLCWGGPTLVSVYDMIHERFAALLVRRWHDQLRRQKAQAVRSADRLICNSESTRADVIDYYGIDPSAVVAIPLACSDVFRVLDQQDDAGEPNGLGEVLSPPFLLWVGGRDAYKDFARFARAFSAWKGGANLRIVIVGSPLTRTEAELLRSLALTEQVVSLTGVDDDALCRLYNRAAALVYPSVYEGFGIPLLEAMACECPVVAARIPTSIEVVGDCATLFEPANAEDLTRALETALADGRGSDRVRRGRHRAARFSWDKNAADTVRVYEELTGKT